MAYDGATGAYIPTRIAEDVSRFAEAWDVTPADILGRSRKVKHTYPRGALIAHLKGYKRFNGKDLYSYPQIAQWLGGRDHTSVLHAHRQHIKRSADLC